MSMKLSGLLVFSHQGRVNAIATFALNRSHSSCSLRLPLKTRPKNIWIATLDLNLVSDIRSEATQQNEGHSGQASWHMPVIPS